MVWFLDFIAYNCPGHKFFIKEIAIVDKDDGDKCYNYFITGPKAYPVFHSSIIQDQHKWHNLEWAFGDYEFHEAMMDIERKVGSETVYVKGRDKFILMCRMLTKATIIELEHIPQVCHLNNCIDERCKVKHGNNCARRQAHELRHYINNNDSFYF